ncbi:hypothetical protein [Achromobacter sp. GD03932]|uniref:hypothetical protein n=1 Tax=Achromobacter sp. GD03932 TaxID=2975407 RepID=UPI00244C9D81|nr:hypothetical protein [Achromobacter sp. GD03932]MDH1298739.1 hypothetical protein [Achromobacter sp. GD03932]
MENILDQGKWALVTMALFLGSLVVNEWVFTNLEFVRGVNWIYLPAGVRLICTLLFGLPAALGLLAGSWIACFCYYFPDDMLRSVAGGIMAAAAPYLACRWARSALRLQPDLGNLTAWRLLICAVVYAVMNTTIHHLWFFLQGERAVLADGFIAMLTGDIAGSLIVLYTLKVVSALGRSLLRRRAA